MPFKLPRSQRILKPSEYRAVFNDGKKFYGKYWQIKARKITAKQPRLGLAISKKICRLAVERNIYKRIAREAFRIHQNTLQNWELAIMAKPNKPKNNKLMAQDLLNVFNQITQNS